MDRRRREGCAEHQPGHAEDGAEADRGDEDEERVHPERGAERDRLDDVLQQAVGKQDDDEHDQRSLRALRPQRKDDGEGARHEGADEGDVGGDEGDDGDRPRERHVEQQRSDPHDDCVERSDDRDATEVPAQRADHVPADRLRDVQRHAHVLVDEPPERRSVLEQEEEAEDREDDEEDECRQALDGGSEPFDEGRDRRRGALGDVLVGARGRRAVDARILEPGLRLVRGGARARPDVAFLRDDAAEHQHEDEDSQDEEPEQDEEGATEARHALSLQPAHDGCRHRCEDETDQHGLDDHRRQCEEEHHPDDEEAEPDEEPRRDAEVPQPPRCGEGRGQLAQLARVELDRLRLDGDRLGLDRTGRSAILVTPLRQLHDPPSI